MLTAMNRSKASSPFTADRRDVDGSGRMESYSTPLSIWETDDRIQLEIDLPGVSVEAIDLNYKDGLLWIRGERGFSDQVGQLRYNDRWYGPFERMIKLPNVIDPASIEAELTNGVLHVTLAKTAEAKPRKVQVRAG